MELNVINFLKLTSKLSSLIEGFDPVFLNKKYNFTLKDKFLVFLLDGEKSPRQLIEFLGIAKTNLALISSELLTLNLIKKQKDNLDKRLINYVLTDLGAQKANMIVKTLKNNASSVLDYKNKNQEINDIILTLIQILN